MGLLSRRGFRMATVRLRDRFDNLEPVGLSINRPGSTSSPQGEDRMTREIFHDQHEAFRNAVGTFRDKEVVPFHEQWEKDGVVDR